MKEVMQAILGNSDDSNADEISGNVFNATIYLYIEKFFDMVAKEDMRVLQLLCQNAKLSFCTG